MRRIFSSTITFVIWYRDNFHLRFCSITSRSGVEIALSVSCSCKASDWLSSSDVILSFLKNSVWVTKPFPSSSYLWKKKVLVLFTADIRHLKFLNACQIYSCAHKFTCPSQNMQNVNNFIKIRWIMKIACYCLFNTVLNKLSHKICLYKIITEFIKITPFKSLNTLES